MPTSVMMSAFPKEVSRPAIGGAPLGAAMRIGGCLDGGAAWLLERRSGSCTQWPRTAQRVGLLERGGVELGEIERGLKIDLRVGEVVDGQAGAERAPQHRERVGVPVGGRGPARL